MNPVSQQAADRRLKLRVAVKLMIYLGLAGVVYVLLSAIMSGSKEIPDVPSMKVDLSDITFAEPKFVTWEGRPVLIFRRTDQQILDLRTPHDKLQDRDSKRSEQPDWAVNDFRSAEHEWFVAIALGTDLGCSLEFLPASPAPFQDVPWPGGFTDTCRKSRYDLSGRVYRSQYATRNLVVPSYRIDGNTLVLGQ